MEFATAGVAAGVGRAIEEVEAECEALVRRGHGVSAATIRIGPLEVDPAAKTARLAGGGRVDLAPREFAVLEYLAHRAGNPVSRTELEEHLYDQSSQVMSNAIDVAISEELGTETVAT